MRESTVKKLNKLQLTFLRYLLKTPRTTAISAMMFDSGLIDMENLLIKKKLNLAHHISTLEEDSLANEIFVAQKRFNFPGLVQECSELINILDLPDITDRGIAKGWSKAMWKQSIRKKINEK